MGNFKVYNSSAGSGKTFTLVADFLALALSSSNTKRYRKMLAITFTNKAAAEMRERIIEKLKLFAEKSWEDEMLKIISTKTGLSNEVISERAAKMLSDILHNYSFLSIGTIDNFSHRIIRSFSRDLDVPQDFEIELDLEDLARKSVDRVLSQAGRDDKLTEQLIEFLLYQMDESKGMHLRNRLIETARLLESETASEYLPFLYDKTPDDFKEIKNILHSKAAQHEMIIREFGNSALNLINSNNIKAESFAGGKSGLSKYFEYLSEYKIDKLEPTSTVNKNIEKNNWYSGKCTPDQKSAIDSICSELRDMYLNATAYIEKYISDIILYSGIIPNIYELSLLVEISKARTEIKNEQGILPISEFNRIIAQVVKDEPAPYIYERIGERFQNIFIDEFQDTSKLQWGNFLPLIDESLSKGNFNMLVGDAKQSIYRWRGGEAEQFIQLPDLYDSENNFLSAQRAQNLLNNYEEAHLASNYRSSKTVVDFNNDLFKCFALHLPSPYQEIYSDAVQKSHSELDTGYVEFKFFSKEAKKDNDEDETKDDLLNVELLNQINDARKDNFSLKDMCILVRSAKSGQEIGLFLSDNGIPVITSDSLLIDRSNYISLLLNLLRYISNPEDQLSATEIIKHFHKIDNSKEDLTQSIFNFSQGKSAKSPRRVNVNSYLKNCGKNELPRDLNSFPVYEVVEILTELYFREHRDNAYIKTFLNFVFISSKRLGNSIESFLELWSGLDKKPSLQFNDDLDAIKIMTIHKSKGLEFPVVFLPDLCWRAHSGNPLWIKTPAAISDKLPVALINSKKDLEKTIAKNEYLQEKVKEDFDDANLFYVASTRARERIYGLLKSEESQTSKKIFSCLSTMEGYNKEENNFKRGSKEIHEANKKGLIEMPEKISYSSSAKSWREKVSVSRQAPENWDVENLSQPYSYGSQLHDVLAEISSIDELDPILIKRIEQGVFTVSESEMIKGKIISLFGIPKVNQWFNNDKLVMAEREIKDGSGNFFRPDRVLIDDKKVIVIDYKTGSEKPEHHIQVQNYMSILRNMDYESVEGYLLYTDQEKVVKLTQEKGEQLALFN